MNSLISSIRLEPIGTRIWLFTFLAPLFTVTFIGAAGLGLGSFRFGYAWSDGMDRAFLYKVPALFVLATLPFYIWGAAAKIKAGRESKKDLLKGLVWILFAGSAMAFCASYFFLLRGVFPYLSLAMSDDSAVSSTFLIKDNQPFGRGDLFRELELMDISNGNIQHTILHRPSDHREICLTYTKSPIGRHVSVMASRECNRR